MATSMQQHAADISLMSAASGKQLYLRTPWSSRCFPCNPSRFCSVKNKTRATVIRTAAASSHYVVQLPLRQSSKVQRWSLAPSISFRPGRDPLCIPRAADEPNGSTGPRAPRSGRPWHWLQRLASSWQQIQPLKLLLQALLLFFLLRLWPIGNKPEGQPENVVVQVPFSEFVKRVKSNEVQTVSIDGLHLNFGLKAHSALLANTPNTEGSGNIKVSFSTVRPADYNVPYEVMEKHGVQFSAVDKRGNRLSLLVWVLYIVILLSALNRLPIKLPQKGAGRKHKGSDSNVTVTFGDVAGVDEAKEELQEIVEYLRAPEKFSKLGARPPSGVLLVGPPGTGKTLLAKAVAGEADAPFFSISASEFVELYVGMGAMRVRELFANARKEAPAIVFIDEIDAVAKGRDMRLRSVGNDEREQTLNQLLTELDGFDSDKDNVVICIAATNRPDVLDAALLRPGRFDRRVSVERPDRLGRMQILKVHLERRNLPLAPDVSVEQIAGATTGFTGADLANLVNEAALLAGRRNQSQVTREEFDMAVMRAVAGIEKKRSILGTIEKDVVAKHEVGHALVSTAIAKLIPGASEVEKLSIIPRSGGALGFTYIPPKTEDRALMFDSEIRGQLAMLMGGRAAEQLYCHAVSTGAADDIRRATNLAYKAVAELGLSPNIGPLNVGVLMNGGGDEGWMMKDSGNISRMVETDVKQLCEAALAVAIDVIVANRAIHEGLSNLLVKTERLEGEQLQRWLHHVRPPPSLREFVLKGNIQGVRDSVAASQSAKALVSIDLEKDEEAVIVLDPKTGLPLSTTELAGISKSELAGMRKGGELPPSQQTSTPTLSPAV